MDNEGISCIAVGDMLKKRLEEYTDALSSGVDKTTLTRMEYEIDKIEAVHEKCVAMGDVTDISASRAGDTPSIVVDEAEGEDDASFLNDSYIEDEGFVVEEDEGN